MSIRYREVKFISSDYLRALLILSGLSSFEHVVTACIERARALSSMWSYC